MLQCKDWPSLVLLTLVLLASDGHERYCSSKDVAAKLLVLFLQRKVVDSEEEVSVLQLLLLRVFLVVRPPARFAPNVH